MNYNENIIGEFTIDLNTLLQQTNAYKNIVFPLDLSAESKQKVKMAIHLGKSYKSTMHILYNKVSDEFLNNKMIANLHQVENIFIENGIEAKKYYYHRFQIFCYSYYKTFDSYPFLLIYNIKTRKVHWWLLYTYLKVSVCSLR